MMAMFSKQAPAIAAIPTTYAGVTFRSRTEARWAVFFDHLDIPWDYEPEGYELATAWYVPDFWLPKQGIFFEVKPGVSPEGFDKCCELIIATGKPVCMSLGAPSIVRVSDEVVETDCQIGFPWKDKDGSIIARWRLALWLVAEHSEWPLWHRAWPFPLSTSNVVDPNDEAFSAISGGCWPLGPKNYRPIGEAIEETRRYRFWDPKS